MHRGSGLVTRVTLQPGEAVCRQARDAELTRRIRVEAEAAASARQFLVEQLQVSDAQTHEACDRG